MSVIKQLDSEVLLKKTDLVVALTATNTKNSLTGHTTVDLVLPSINTDNAPKFSQTYYTAVYSVSGENALVTFDDASLKISNKENLGDISIGIDSKWNRF